MRDRRTVHRPRQKLSEWFFLFVCGKLGRSVVGWHALALNGLLNREKITKLVEVQISVYGWSMSIRREI